MIPHFPTANSQLFSHNGTPLEMLLAPDLQKSINTVIERAMSAYLSTNSIRIIESLGAPVEVTVLFESRGIKVSSSNNRDYVDSNTEQARAVLAEINGLIADYYKAKEMTLHLENAHKTIEKKLEQSSEALEIKTREVKTLKDEIEKQEVAQKLLKMRITELSAVKSEKEEEEISNLKEKLLSYDRQVKELKEETSRQLAIEESKTADLTNTLQEREKELSSLHCCFQSTVEELKAFAQDLINLKAILSVKETEIESLKTELNRNQKKNRVIGQLNVLIREGLEEKSEKHSHRIETLEHVLLREKERNAGLKILSVFRQIKLKKEIELQKIALEDSKLDLLFEREVNATLRKEVAIFKNLSEDLLKMITSKRSSLDCEEIYEEDSLDNTLPLSGGEEDSD